MAEKPIPMFLHPASRLLSGSLFVGIALCLTMTMALAEASHTRCGDEVQVRKGETLSSLAERCDITEARILDLNPNIEGSRDLRTGMTLNLAAPTTADAAAKAQKAADSVFARLKSYANDVEQTVDRAAGTARQSIEEFLQRNPDLHQRVRKLGQRLNIPGMEKVEAQVSLSVRKGTPGTPVTLSAIGLPSNQGVEIAGGAPASDYQIIDSGRTSAEGTLQVTVQVPSWADPQRDFLFVIAVPNGNLAVRSATFDVLETTAKDDVR